MLLAIFGFILVLPVILVLIGIAISGPRYRGPVSDHFDGRRFLNQRDVRAKGGMELLKWMVNRKQGTWNEDLSEGYGKYPLRHFRDGIRVTFINHTTFLIQADGLNILTDPVWSRRVSPFPWVGPRRMKLPGIRFGDLPKIHVVLLTHNHYDHLDIATMRLVFGAHHPRVIVPLGVKAFLDRHRIPSVETDWWEEVHLENNVIVRAVPAQHFSGRGFLDRDATLWCGFVIKTGKGNIYFAGDTGYNEVTFREIPSRCGPIRVAMLPIGAYKPGWFMSPIHTSPADALRIHLDVGATASIGMHFGTFPLADDGQHDPVTDLRKALEALQLSADDFIVLKEGEVRVFE